jgi:asparagine synthase (glutamine-hydrolysing)
MAHSIEIRVPLVDFTLLAALATAIPALASGAGKAALAKAPTSPLPNDIVIRAKTGFSVPTGAWMNTAADKALGPTGREPGATGLVSRRWSRAVLDCLAPANRQPGVQAS